MISPSAFVRLCGALLLSTLAFPVSASGFGLIDIPATAHEPALHGAVWYPCEAHTVPIQLGPVTLQGSHGCALQEQQVPLIVISHGSGGSFLGHHDTAEALAGAGLVVAAISHPGDSFQDLAQQGHLSSFATRPQDIRRLIDYMTQRWPLHRHLNAQRVGLFGFSRGGYTGLVLAGARVDFRQGLAQCAKNNYPLCREIRQGQLPAIPGADPRIKAMVLADPLKLFNAAGLGSVKVALQLWVSEAGGDGVTPQAEAALLAALPPHTESHVVTGAGHFAFLAPCSAQQQAHVPEICRDRPGFDRAAFHRDFNAQMSGFFLTHLGMP